MVRARPSHVLAVALLLASPAAAGPVSPSDCHIPPVIRLAGQRTQGVLHPPDTGWPFEVVIRDAAETPINGALVRIHFGACQQSFPASDQSVSEGDACGTGVFEDVTGPDGVAEFVISGATLHRSAFDQTPNGCLLVTVEDPLNPGVEIPLPPTPAQSHVRVAAFDLDGVNGVRASDLWLFLCDRFNGPFLPCNQRVDYNGDTSVNPVDLSLWFSAYFLGGSQETRERCDGLPAEFGTDVVNGVLGIKASKCGVAGGTGSLTLTCAPDDPPARLIATVSLPADLDLAAGFEGVIDVIGPVGSPLPPYFQWLSYSCPPEIWDFIAAGAGCGYPFGSSSNATEGFWFEWPYPDGPNAGRDDMARLRFIVAPNGTDPIPPVQVAPSPMSSGVQYAAFALQLQQDPNIVPDCAPGCTTPMAFEFKSLRITRPGGGTASCSDPMLGTNGVASVGPDLLIYSLPGDTNSVVFVNGVPSGYPVTSVAAPSAAVSRLEACVPNPARESVAIRFALARAGEASLAVFDVAGRRVRELATGRLEAGDHSTTWDLLRDDGTRAPSGTYFVRLREPSGVKSRTLIALD